MTPARLPRVPLVEHTRKKRRSAESPNQSESTSGFSPMDGLFAQLAVNLAVRQR
jgi:hypothetical protein